MAASRKGVAEEPPTPSRRYPPSTDYRYLYHVTLARGLPGIAKGGLRPSRHSGVGFWQKSHLKDAIFLSSPEVLPWWYGQVVSTVLGWWSDGTLPPETGEIPWEVTPVKKRLVPVTLRMAAPICDLDLWGIQGTEVQTVADLRRMGARHGPSYRCETSVPAGAIDVWTGSAWVPVRDYRQLDLAAAWDPHPRGGGDEWLEGEWVTPHPLLPRVPASRKASKKKPAKKDRRKLLSRLLRGT